jgi:hypothetical protein
LLILVASRLMVGGGRRKAAPGIKSIAAREKKTDLTAASVHAASREGRENKHVQEHHKRRRQWWGSLRWQPPGRIETEVGRSVEPGQLCSVQQQTRRAWRSTSRSYGTNPKRERGGAAAGCVGSQASGAGGEMPESLHQKERKTTCRSESCARRKETQGVFLAATR